MCNITSSIKYQKLFLFFKTSRKCGFHGCPNQGIRLCPPCQSIAYCSEICQRKDWVTHRHACIFFHVVPKKDNPSHKIVVAARNLSAGTLIVEESSAIIGPKYVSDTSPVCLSCCCIISEDIRKCMKCSWPVCSVSCEMVSFLNWRWLHAIFFTSY